MRAFFFRAGKNTDFCKVCDRNKARQQTVGYAQQELAQSGINPIKLHEQKKEKKNRPFLVTKPRYFPRSLPFTSSNSQGHFIL